MITLHVLQLLEDNGYGQVNLEGNLTGTDLLFWEKLPEGQTGVYILSDGAPLDRALKTSQNFTLYARGTNDVQGNQWLEDILTFFSKECYPVCDLPIVPGYSDNEYTNVTIIPSSNTQNIGKDDTNRLIWSASATVTYTKKETV